VNSTTTPETNTEEGGLVEPLVICAFRELREKWFNAKLKRFAHEREWEEEWQTESREEENRGLKVIFDKQTEEIIAGNAAPIAPTCSHDMSI